MQYETLRTYTSLLHILKSTFVKFHFPDNCMETGKGILVIWVNKNNPYIYCRIFLQNNKDIIWCIHTLDRYYEIITSEIAFNKEIYHAFSIIFNEELEDVHCNSDI